MQVETVVVVAGGHPSPGGVPELPERRVRDRGRLRRRPGARARAPHRSRDRRLRLGLGRPGSQPPRRRVPSIERHPAAKDATDLELALDAAIALEPSRILVDRRRRRPARPPARLDPAARRRPLRGATVDAYLDGNRLAVIRGSRTLTGTPGEIVTLLPVHGPAAGVTTRGSSTRFTTRPSHRARPAVSRTSSPPQKPRSRSWTAAWSPSSPAPSERSPCDTLAQARWQR